MCDECEEIEPLTVAYYGKMERNGWRPPASARTEPIHDDRQVTGRPYAIQYAMHAPRFVCEPQAAAASIQGVQGVQGIEQAEGVD